MARRTLKHAAIVVAVVAAAVLGPPAGGRYIRFVRTAFAQDDLGSPRRLSQLTFLQVNDVYTTVPMNGVGGLARVATLRKQLSQNGHPVIMALAGDFLSPSVESSVFKGEQMVATLNAAGLDYAVLGNHEFDFGIDVLKQRMAESKFTWILSNVLDANGKTIGASVPYVIREVGGMKIGIIGLCITTSTIAPAWKNQFRLVDPMVAAAHYLPILTRQGVNVIVAITHLTFIEDRELARKFPVIDLIIGGHEHYPLTATENHALISKAGSDAKFAARIDLIWKPAAGNIVERFFELVPITKDIADDPDTARVAGSYEARLGAELETVVGTSTTPLDAGEARLVAESGLGNMIADALREDVGADIGLSNAGGARGSRVYPAGPLTRRTLLSIHPFGNIVCKIEVNGRVLLEALNHGVALLPLGGGRFPQLSGVTMKVDVKSPVGSRVSDVRVNGAPLDATKTYTIALPDYMMNGGDGYAMFAGQKVLIDAQSGDLVVQALEKYVAKRGTISPVVEGRVVIAR